MTDRDETTGQFIHTVDSATNAPALPPILSDPVPYEETPVEETPVEEVSAGSTIAEEAARLKAQRASTPDGEIRSFSGVADLDQNVTLTIEQATKIASDVHAADAAQVEADQDQAIRDEVDRLRAATPTETETPEAADLDVEKVLTNPKIRAAFEANVRDAEAAKQSYVAGLTAATQIAQASFMSRFPEFVNIPEAQRGAELLRIQQYEPTRYLQIKDEVERSAGLFREQEAAQQQAEQARAARMKAENARFEQSIKDVPKERRSEIENEIVAAITERGSNIEQVAKFLEASQASSEVMGLLWELGETRATLKAIRSAPRAVAPKNLPPVARPGVAGIRGPSQSASSQIAKLQRQ